MSSMGSDLTLLTTGIMDTLQVSAGQARSPRHIAVRALALVQMLSQSTPHRDFDTFGPHYQSTVWLWRTVSAQIGK
jgi:hypothetical protein